MNSSNHQPDSRILDDDDGQQDASKNSIQKYSSNALDDPQSDYSHIYPTSNSHSQQIQGIKMSSHKNQKHLQIAKTQMKDLSQFNKSQNCQNQQHLQQQQFQDVQARLEGEEEQQQLDQKDLQEQNNRPIKMTLPVSSTQNIVQETKTKKSNINSSINISDSQEQEEEGDDDIRNSGPYDVNQELQREYHKNQRPHSNYHHGQNSKANKESKILKQDISKRKDKKMSISSTSSRQNNNNFTFKQKQYDSDGIDQKKLYQNKSSNQNHHNLSNLKSSGRYKKHFQNLRSDEGQFDEQKVKLTSNTNIHHQPSFLPSGLVNSKNRKIGKLSAIGFQPKGHNDKIYWENLLTGIPSTQKQSSKCRNHTIYIETECYTRLIEQIPELKPQLCKVILNSLKGEKYNDIYKEGESVTWIGDDQLQQAERLFNLMKGDYWVFRFKQLKPFFSPFLREFEQWQHLIIYYYFSLR